MARDLIEEIIAGLRKQQSKGLAKYKVPVDPTAEDVEIWLRHSIEEKVDDLVYSTATLDSVIRLRNLVTKQAEEIAIQKEQIKQLLDDLTYYQQGGDLY